jgi:hypothetical protein
MSLRKKRDDKRNPATREPNINWASVFKAYHRIIIGPFLIILLIVILALFEKSFSESLKSFIYFAGGASVIYTFGENI